MVEQTVKLAAQEEAFEDMVADLPIVEEDVRSDVDAENMIGDLEADASESDFSSGSDSD